MLRSKLMTMVAMLVANLYAGSAGANEPATRMIGFRHDGTGIFPADCKPPTEFDGVKGVNLAWKVPLPNFGNGSPIVVGKKAFVVCAAGWPEGQDCAVLLCFDAGSGKELWRQDLDEFVTMPAERAKEARAIRAEYHKRIRRLNRIMFEYQSADEATKEALLKEAAMLGAGKVDPFEKYSWGVGSAEQSVFGDKEFGARLRKVCGYSPIVWSPSTLGVDMPTPVSDGRRVYVWNGRRTVHAYDLEGRALWHVWQSDAPYNYHWPEDCANAPQIVDDKLLMYVFDHLWAYQVDTGQLAWKTQSGVIRHGMGTPVILHLPIPAQAGKTESMMFLWTGDLVRVRDGRKMLTDVTKVIFGSMTSDHAQRVYLTSYGSGSVESKGIQPGQLKFALADGSSSGGTMALRFALSDANTATVEQVWTAPDRLGSYPILWKGQLHTVNGGVLDAETGRALSPIKKGKGIGENAFILANGHFYGQPGTAPGWPRAGRDNPDTMEVINVKPVTTGAAIVSMPLAPMPGTIADPEQRRKVVAMTGFAYYKGSYGWHPPSAAPFASGNRLFVRTFDALYCFGDKSVPFTPSKAFQ